MTMIDEQKYEEVLDNGLILDHYLLLCNIRSGIAPSGNKRVQGFINLLTKKEYLDAEGKLTEKALDLVQNCSFIEVLEKENKMMDFNSWVKQLRESMMNKLKEVSGKSNVLAKVNGRGKGYYFIPNDRDLANKIEKMMSLYKIKDKDLIEKKLLAYVQQCAETKEYFPLIKYYILKDGVSALADSLDEPDEVQDNYKSTQKFI